MRKVIAVLALMALAGCASLDLSGPLRPFLPSEPPISAATFCEVMASQGGAFRWSAKDSRISKERADKLNAVWKLCPQYKPPPPPTPAPPAEKK